jgi:hypothetical protein
MTVRRMGTMDRLLCLLCHIAADFGGTCERHKR